MGLSSLPERVTSVPVRSTQGLNSVTESCLTVLMAKSVTVQIPALPFPSHTLNHPDGAGKVEQRDGLGRIWFLPVGKLLTMLAC